MLVIVYIRTIMAMSVGIGNLPEVDIRNLVENVHRDLIIETINIRPMVGKLIVSDVQTKNTIGACLRQNDLKESVSTYLVYLKKMDDVREYSLFVQLINEEEYTYLGKLLRGEDTQDASEYIRQRRTIEYYCADIIREVDFNYVLHRLIEDQWIDDEDNAQLVNLRNTSSNEANRYLICEVIPRKKEYWFKLFMQLLRDSDCTRLVDEITGENKAHVDADAWSTCTTSVSDVTSEDYLSVTMDLSLRGYNCGMEGSRMHLNKYLREADPKYSISIESSEENNELQTLLEDLDIFSSDPREKISLDNRPYQEELAEAAINGKNVLIIAPTGSGKTVVALMIMLDHLTRNGSPMKIVFFANEVTLVEQQCELCKIHLPNDIKVLVLSGETQNRNGTPISQMIQENDIIFMTPQIMVDALDRKQISSLSLFSLFVFDECHHVKSKHPTNKIMTSYVDMKLAGVRTLPQIVGLTASIGVGRKIKGDVSEVERAKKHIYSLCANMDAVAGLVTVVVHKDSLEKHTNQVETVIKTPMARTSDPFKQLIIEIMKEIEDKLTETTLQLTKLAKYEDVHVKRSVMHGSQKYRQWLAHWFYVVLARCKSTVIRFRCVPLLQHLAIYDRALNINEDCRAYDALLEIKTSFEQLNPRVDEITDIDNILGLYTEKLPVLEQHARLNQNLNPKLILLKLDVINQIREDPESKILIFVKTRCLTTAMLRWMRDDNQLKLLRPVVVTGCGVSTSKGGMTKDEQKEAVKLFKWGTSSVAIATSVAQEGMDFAKCKLVDCYEFVSNEIGHIQAKGRASRIEGGHYSLITSNHKLAEKESANIKLESIMAEAVHAVQNIYEDNPSAWGLCLRDIQLHSQQKRVDEEQKEKERPRSKDVFSLNCYKCGQFICKSTDIRVLNGSQHFVMKPIWHLIYEVPHTNAKRYQEFDKTSKVYCKQQNCQIDWGVGGLYRSVKFIGLSVKNLILCGPDKQYHRKKWKRVPFTCETLTDDELHEYKRNFNSL